MRRIILFESSLCERILPFLPIDEFLEYFSLMHLKLGFKGILRMHIVTKQ